ncbi:MAG: hypothetical protein D6784_14345 [Chloroflexi bacterium]|nr:MAG: hypothetical protein D6784_14345 [Chloroflexota bacterium]
MGGSQGGPLVIVQIGFRGNIDDVELEAGVVCTADNLHHPADNGIAGRLGNDRDIGPLHRRRGQHPQRPGPAGHGQQEKQRNG